MKTNFRVRSHDKYSPGHFRVELTDEEHGCDATLIVPDKELKDFPVGGVISLASEIVEKAPEPKAKLKPQTIPPEVTK